jgi:hypothetical protein
MKRYFKYLQKILIHKYFVFIWCIKLKAPLRLAIFHDISKFSIHEFGFYARRFYDKNGNKLFTSDSLGTYDPIKTNFDFAKGWLHHQHCNKHHWNFWIIIRDGKLIIPVEIPKIYVLEMVADWAAARKSYSGKYDVIAWYEKEKDNMILTEKTRNLLEKILYDNFE